MSLFKTFFLIRTTPPPSIANATIPTVIGTKNAKLLPVLGVTIVVSATESSFSCSVLPGT